MYHEKEIEVSMLKNQMKRTNKISKYDLILVLTFGFILGIVYSSFALFDTCENSGIEVLTIFGQTYECYPLL